MQIQGGRPVESSPDLCSLKFEVCKNEYCNVWKLPRKFTPTAFVYVVCYMPWCIHSELVSIVTCQDRRSNESQIEMNVKLNVNENDKRK